MELKDREVMVLGTKYDLVFKDGEKEDCKLEYAGGYFDHSTKTIVIDNYNSGDYIIEDIGKTISTAIRHELVHAFLTESGLRCNTKADWARNEEMVDWIALQMPKMVLAMEAFL